MSAKECFSCNVPGCEQEVRETCITSCSHVYCYDHAQQWFSSNEHCMICNATGIHVRVMDFSKESINEKKQTSLVGYLPADMLEAMNTALGFWTYQKLREIKEARVAFEEEREKRQKIEATLVSTESSLSSTTHELHRVKNELRDARAEALQWRDKYAEKKGVIEQLEAELRNSVSRGRSPLQALPSGRSDMSSSNHHHHAAAASTSRVASPPVSRSLPAPTVRSPRDLFRPSLTNSGLLQNQQQNTSNSSVSLNRIPLPIKPNRPGQPSSSSQVNVAGGNTFRFDPMGLNRQQHQQESSRMRRPATPPPSSFERSFLNKRQA